MAKGKELICSDMYLRQRWSGEGNGYRILEHGVQNVECAFTLRGWRSARVDGSDDPTMI